MVKSSYSSVTPYKWYTKAQLESAAPVWNLGFTEDQNKTRKNTKNIYVELF